MTEDDISARELTGILMEAATGEDHPSIDKVIRAVKQNQAVLLASEGVRIVRTLVMTETPGPDGIAELSKDELPLHVMRINFLSKFRLTPVDGAQLEALQERTRDLWGEHPTEPTGRWAEWCLWTLQQKRASGQSLTEVVAGEKDLQELLAQWRERHEAREEARKVRKIENVPELDDIEDVPPSLRAALLSPFFRSLSDAEDKEVSRTVGIDFESSHGITPPKEGNA